MQDAGKSAGKKLIEYCTNNAKGRAVDDKIEANKEST